MPTVDFVVESDLDATPRVRQLGSMFDCPIAEKSRVQFKLDFPIEAKPWNVGLMVGPSGSGKSSVMRQVFGEMPTLEWGAPSLVDDFDTAHSVEDIARACSAVGFNTIPAWMRPFSVLSNGEQFRVDLARRALELPAPVVVDEFTSVVDRQVAQIGSHAMQKFVRRQSKQFVAVTCHYDVVDWLQPDWILDMATQSFTRRLVQRRPAIECVIGRLPYAAWRLFAPFHYLTADLHRSARCYGLWANGHLAAFAGVLHMPHPKIKDLKRVSRIVTLPDWQGMGLAFVLLERLGAAHRGVGLRLRNYPAHPSFVRAHDRSRDWSMKKRPGKFSTAASDGNMGGRPCAVFEYCGAADGLRESQRLLALG